MSVGYNEALSVDEAVLEQVEEETLRFVEVARHSPFDAVVPTYPAFSVATLSAHVGRVLRVFRDVVVDGAVTDGDPFAAPSGPEVFDWLVEGLEPALHALREVDTDALLYLPRRTVASSPSEVASALLVEVGVHRWDLESVIGAHAPIPTDLAVRAIDSVVENFVPLLASAGVESIGGKVRVQATDSPDGWSFAVVDGALRAERASNTNFGADVMVSGAAAELALIVWKRSSFLQRAVNVVGPIGVFTRLLEIDYVPNPLTTAAH